jgi:hypothetical protein
VKNTIGVEKVVVRTTLEEHMDDGSVISRTECFTSMDPDADEIEMLREYMENVANLEAYVEGARQVLASTKPPPGSN